MPSINDLFEEPIDFSEESVDKLKSDVGVEDEAKSLTGHAEDRHQRYIDDLDQQFGQRRILFWAVICLVVAAVVSVIGIGLLVIFNTPKVGDAVVIALISGLTVQSFSLTAIIATGLYSVKRRQAQAEVERVK